MGIEDIEPFDNELGSPGVHGEDDCLANRLATVNPQAIFHQVLKHFVYCVGIVDIIVYLLLADVAGHVFFTGVFVDLFIFPYLFELLLFFIRQVIILDALIHYL